MSDQCRFPANPSSSKFPSASNMRSAVDPSMRTRRAKRQKPARIFFLIIHSSTEFFGLIRFSSEQCFHLLFLSTDQRISIRRPDQFSELLCHRSVTNLSDFFLYENSNSFFVLITAFRLNDRNLLFTEIEDLKLGRNPFLTIQTFNF